MVACEVREQQDFKTNIFFNYVAYHLLLLSMS